MLIYMVIIILLGLALVNAVRAVIVSTRIRREAPEDFKYRQTHGMIDASATENDFTKAFKRSHGARGSVYAAVTLFSAAILTPPLLAFISISYDFIWRMTGQDRAFEPGYLVWQFILFGSVIGGWCLIGYIGARLYYKNLPGSLETEIAAQMRK